MQAPLPESAGPVRQLCQILDYRYARYVSTPAYIVDPFIHRGLLEDTQLWVSPVYDNSETDGNRRIDPVRATVVIRTFPLMSWLWVGLFVLLTAALVLTIRAWTGVHHP